jgi:hypothetical protein
MHWHSKGQLVVAQRGGVTRRSKKRLRKHFFLLSNLFQMNIKCAHSNWIEARMSPFTKAAATLAGCIGAFTMVVCIVEVLAN